jgi:hypothetical protein
MRQLLAAGLEDDLNLLNIYARSSSCGVLG